MALNEHAYAELKSLRHLLDDAGLEASMRDAAAAIAYAGGELKFYQDEEVARVGRDLVDIGSRMGTLLRDLQATESRIAGLL